MSISPPVTQAQSSAYAALVSAEDGQQPETKLVMGICPLVIRVYRNCVGFMSGVLCGVLSEFGLLLCGASSREKPEGTGRHQEKPEGTGLVQKRRQGTGLAHKRSTARERSRFIRGAPRNGADFGRKVEGERGERAVYRYVQFICSTENLLEASHICRTTGFSTAKHA